MFVAVVYKFHPDTDPDSHKDHGGWESFLGETKEEAVEKAILAAQRWENQLRTVPDPATGMPKSKYYGPYKVLVGQLTEEAKRASYTLAAYTEGWV